MSRFHSPLLVELVDDDGDGGIWRLTAALIYESDVARQTIHVPAGYQTDFASVPRIPIAYWLTGSTAHAPAVVHDHLYSTGVVPRAVADRVLREAMATIGMPAWRRWSMYAAVRLFGGRRYRC